MEAASEEFCKFLAISGKQSGTEREKPRNPELPHARPPLPSLLNGSNLFQQPGDEETLRNFKADKSELVRGDSKHFQSETAAYEVLDGLDNLAHYEGLSGKSHCERPRCSERFENQIGKKSHFGGWPSDAVASDVLVEGDDVHPREVDPAFLCLTDDQKASSALCTDLYEEVRYINIILSRV